MLKPLQGLLQQLGLHAPLVVNRQTLKPISGQSHHACGLEQGYMGIGAAEHHALLASPLRQAIAGHQEGHQIAEGAAGRQHAAPGVRKAKPRGEPAAELPLKITEAW